MRLRKIKTLLYILINLLGVNRTEGRKGIGNGEQEWGYISVRPHAYMFWWLYHTTASVHSYTDRPLIIWLQGGPGMPSSGYGNFLEIGPLDMNLQPRNHTWVKNFNILFLDNPVGVGYSYISRNATRMAQNNKEIGEDLVNFVENFLMEFPEFQKVPLYIFGESYGGKMAVEFGHQLNERIQIGKIDVNFKGIGLGGAYISPIDYIINYAPLALNLGFADTHGYKRINELTEEIREVINRGEYATASEIETRIIDTVIEIIQGIDIYNIILRSNVSLPTFLSYQDSCNELMNGNIKKALFVSDDIQWNFLNDDIYNALHGDLMRPVTETIEILLNSTDVKIIVFNGVFDFIVNTVGTASWLDKLNWNGTAEWHNATRESLEINMVNEAFMKKVDNLVFYTVLRAGHSVPIDNPIAMDEILRRELLDG